MNKPLKYSLWEFDHVSAYTVMAYKVKDTNSGNEVERFMRDHPFDGGASFYYDTDCLNALYVQAFQND
jgi:hypothetical protein